MDIDSTKLTVFFEAPFWIGVFERIERRKLSVCKVVFGAEPKDYEIWEYLLIHQIERLTSKKTAHRYPIKGPVGCLVR